MFQFALVVNFHSNANVNGDGDFIEGQMRRFNEGLLYFDDRSRESVFYSLYSRMHAN